MAFWQAVPEEDAHLYAEGVRRGGSLVTAKVEEDEVGASQTILNNSRAVDLADRRAKYTADGWSRFDETADLYSREQIAAERERYVIVPPLFAE